MNFWEETQHTGEIAEAAIGGSYLIQGFRTSGWDFLSSSSFLLLSFSLLRAAFMHQPLATGRNLPACRAKQTVLPDGCSCTVAGASAKRFPFWRLILGKTSAGSLGRIAAELLREILAITKGLCTRERRRDRLLSRRDLSNNHRNCSSDRLPKYCNDYASSINDSACVKKSIVMLNAFEYIDCPRSNAKKCNVFIICKIKYVTRLSNKYRFMGINISPSGDATR